MRRMLLAGMLALPFALAMATDAQAQGPGCNTPGGCGMGGPAMYGAAPTGIAPGGYGTRYRLFFKLHYEGPLVNYGPYTGYYPFQPYGPWTSDLRYTGPLAPMQTGTANTGLVRINEFSTGFNGFGFGGLHLGIRTSPCGTCSSGHSWGTYSLATLTNITFRINPWHNRGSGSCSSCHSAIQPDQSIQAASLAVTER